MIVVSLMEAFIRSGKGGKAIVLLGGEGRATIFSEGIRRGCCVDWRDEGLFDCFGGAEGLLCCLSEGHGAIKIFGKREEFCFVFFGGRRDYQVVWGARRGFFFDPTITERSK